MQPEMNNSDFFTADQLVEQRHELPDGGRWMELVDGKLVDLEPPDDKHGTTVLNLSQALASYFQQSESESQAYACFELGLIVSRSPDTVRFPAACCFIDGERFAEQDKIVTETTPVWVIEIASNNQRRRDTKRRVEEYLSCGVELVWVIDPLEKLVHTFPQNGTGGHFPEHHSLTAESVFAGLQIRIDELFAVPEWWKG